MSRPTALITGGCGFVGRHFIRYLLARDYAITVVDDLSTGLSPERWPVPVALTPDQRSRVSFQVCDFRDFAKERNADYDLIVHLAAVVGGRMTIEGDPLAVATDLAIDSTMFNWAVKSNPRPRKLIYFSSSAAYPISKQGPREHQLLSEDMIDLDSQIGVPDMTYGWAKLTGEFLARYAAATYGLDVAVYRPFSGYGEDQDLTYPFPSIIRRVAMKESPLVIWGSGDQLRDFIHIDDVVEAVFASCFRMPPATALNLGSGTGTSFRTLMKLACDVAGHSAPIVNDPTKPEGVFARVGDCTRMQSFYTPRISLRDGVERAYERYATAVAESLVSA